MSTRIAGPFAQQLETHRTRFNTKFAEAKRQHPRLNPAAFADVLSASATPVVDAVARVAPERVPETVDMLYDLALELTASDLLGASTRYPFVAQGWERLLPALARFVAESPREVAGSVTNALYNLAVTASARPHEWASLILKLAEHCADVDTLLKAGQVAAWRAGMAHYRTSALALCRELPPAVAHVALGLPASDAPLTATLNALAADPWLNPDSTPNLKSEIKNPKCIARVGAFRGFGGLFLRPPIVAAAGEHFLVTDGEDSWLLVADVFGATFHRRSGVPTTQPESPFTLGKDGNVQAHRQSVKFAELANTTSHAANAHTLAVTTALSHSIFLVAWVIN
ncbi:MAG: hypothetical protein ACT4QE_24510 [Anaerolineales bacterium]